MRTIITTILLLAACAAAPETPPFTLPAPTEVEPMVPPQMHGEPLGTVVMPFTAAAAAPAGGQTWGGHPPLPGVIQDWRFDFSGLPAAILNPPPSQTAGAFATRIAERLRTIGRYRYVPSVGACVAQVPLPRLTPGSAEPVVGEEVVLTGDRIPQSWFPIVMAQIEQAPVDRDADLTLFGMTGCRLALDLERIVFFSPAPTGLVTRSPNGDVVIRWTPEETFKGYTVTWQLLCLVPRTVVASERLLSGAVQVTVGAR